MTSPNLNWWGLSADGKAARAFLLKLEQMFPLFPSSWPVYWRTLKYWICVIGVTKSLRGLWAKLLEVYSLLLSTACGAWTNRAASCLAKCPVWQPIWGERPLIVCVTCDLVCKCVCFTVKRVIRCGAGALVLEGPPSCMFHFFLCSNTPGLKDWLTGFCRTLRVDSVYRCTIWGKNCHFYMAI